MKNLLTLILVLTFSCQRLPSKRKTLPQNHPLAVIKKIPVTDAKEAKHVIENNVNFFKFTFEQSRDPYYGVPKWDEKCLQQNQIGKIIEEAKMISSISEMVVNENNAIGFCMSFTQRHTIKFIIYQYCGGSEVLEIKIPTAEKEHLELIHLCP